MCMCVRVCVCACVRVCVCIRTRATREEGHINLGHLNVMGTTCTEPLPAAVGTEVQDVAREFVVCFGGGFCPPEAELGAVCVCVKERVYDCVCDTVCVCVCVCVCGLAVYSRPACEQHPQPAVHASSWQVLPFYHPLEQNFCGKTFGKTSLIHFQKIQSASVDKVTLTHRQTTHML